MSHHWKLVHTVFGIHLLEQQISPISSGMVDAFYTPPELARTLIASAKCATPSIIVDFAAGEGSLLEAAEAKWPSAEYYAFDIDRNALARIQRRHSDWNRGVADFLQERSWRRSKLLLSLVGRADLIVLNPPFSSRGGAYHLGHTAHGPVRGSLAGAFVVSALRFLKPGGEVVAVMPASFIASEKDAAVRAYLDSQGSWSLIADYGRETFADCFPRTVVVRFSLAQAARGPRAVKSGYKSLATASHQEKPQKIVGVLVRGVIPVHALGATSRAGLLRRFAHTTDIADGKVHPRLEIVPRPGRTVRSGAVIIQRVGTPSLAKLAVYSGREQLVLSDCLFAFQCSSIAAATKARKLIADGWHHLESTYVGTGARYTTADRLKTVLRRLGLQVRSDLLLEKSHYRKFRSARA